MWEYKDIVVHWGEVDKSISLFNEAGNNGWELCSVLMHVNGRSRTAYFKRFIPLVKTS